MKRSLIALFLTPGLAFAFDCEELSRTAERVEIELMRSYDKAKCDSDRNEDNCNNLATVMTKLRQLKNERALLEGIEKLKTDIQTQKQEVSRLTGNGAQAAALDFSKGLAIAQTFEAIVNSPNALQKITNARLNLTENANFDLRSSFRDVPNFRPTPEAIEELRTVLRGSLEVNEELVNRWKQALTIQKTNLSEGQSAEYSFTQMRTDVAQNGSIPASFSREQLDLIKNVSDFGSAPELNFLAQTKVGKSNAILRDKFKLLTEDLINRQQEELRTTISFAVVAHKDALAPASNSAECSNSKSDGASAMICAGQLKAQMSSLSSGNDAQRAAYQDLNSAIQAADVTKRYIENISSKTDGCLSAINSSLSTAADINITACEGIVTKNMDEMNSDIAALELKKEEILASTTPNRENSPSPSDLSNLRNFAFDKIRQQCPVNISNSIVEDCNPTNLDQNIGLLTTDSMNIAISVLKKDTGDSVEATDISSICDQSPNQTDVRYLCDLTTVVTADSGTISDAPTGGPAGGSGRRERMRAPAKEEKPFWNGVSQALPGLGYQLGQNRVLAQQQAYNNALWLNSLRNSLYPSYSLGAYPTYYPQYGLVSGLTYLPTSGVPTYSSFTASPLSTTTGSSNYFYLQY